MEGFEGFDEAEIGKNLPDEFKIDVREILSKVNLKDKPIMLLIGFHVVLFIFSMLLRKHRLGRTVMFAISTAVAMSAEKVGTFVEQHWEEFGFTNNYFDENGIFLLFFFAVPPVFNCILLFSQLAGDLGGRMCERYLARAAVATKKEEKEEETQKEEEKEEKEKNE